MHTSTPRIRPACRLGLLALSALVSACASLSNAAGLTAGVKWTVSATNCPGTTAIPVSLIVDGSIVGDTALAPGQSSKLYAVARGSHRIEARTPNDAYDWSRRTDDYLVAGETFVRILECR